MSQSINVKLIDQDNHTIKTFGLDIAKLIHHLREMKCEDDYPFVYSIDEYDKTVLNKKQCETLAKELVKMSTDDRMIVFRNQITSLEVILHDIEKYDYLVFEGD